MRKRKIQNLYFIIITTSLLFGLLGNYTNANDCSAARIYMDGNFTSIDNWKYEKILPKTAMLQALINLKSFCCDVNIFGDVAKQDNCVNDSAIKDDGSYPSSAYLYDHILDISMRRLDAKQKNKNGDDLLHGLEPDKKGLAWRSFITKQANSKDGSIPLQITNKFKENRNADEYGLKAWDPKYDLPWSDKEIDSYDKRNLASKYKGVCETSIYLYLNYPGEKDKSKLNTAYKKCEEMSDERIQKEFDYTKSVLMQKGNKLLYNNIKSYLDIYFSQNKLVSLQQLVFNIKNTFSEINKAVGQLVHKCSG